MDTSKGLDNIDGVVWFDGQYVDWKDAKVHVLTHTLHYGLGVFEVLELILPRKDQRFSVLRTTQIAFLNLQIQLN